MAPPNLGSVAGHPLPIFILMLFIVIVILEGKIGTDDYNDLL